MPRRAKAWSSSLPVCRHTAIIGRFPHATMPVSAEREMYRDYAYVYGSTGSSHCLCLLPSFQHASTGSFTICAIITARPIGGQYLYCTTGEHGRLSCQVEARAGCHDWQYRHGLPMSCQYAEIRFLSLLRLARLYAGRYSPHARRWGARRLLGR